MITIEILEGSNPLLPIRELTIEEKSTVTSSVFNGLNYIYYQGDEPTIEPILIVESTEEKLQKNKAFGNQLLDTFLVDNMNMQIAFTTELSMAMMQRFSPIEFLARNGDIKNVRLLIMNSTIDAVFTQERKDKYVLMCSNYLGL
jgi:hypothetical protein